MQGLAKQSRYAMVEINGIKLEGDVVDNEELIKITQQRHNGHAVYPSLFELRQVVQVKFRKVDTPFTATIRGIHFYPGKVKYDLGLWLDDGGNSETEANDQTRIYNVDSCFVYLDPPQTA